MKTHNLVSGESVGSRTLIRHTTCNLRRMYFFPQRYADPYKCGFKG